MKIKVVEIDLLRDDAKSTIDKLAKGGLIIHDSHSTTWFKVCCAGKNVNKSTLRKWVMSQ